MTATEFEFLGELEEELEEEALELEPLFFRPLVTARERHEGEFREVPAWELRSRAAAKRPTPPAFCANYVRGEVQKSRTARGHLPSDVIAHPRGLLIANFGVDWRTPRESLKRETALQNWLRESLQVIQANPTTKLRILGFSDCVGNERKNALLRRGRAVRTLALLNQMMGNGPQWRSFKSNVGYVGAAPAGEYISDNDTIEGRAKNRSVLIESSRTVNFNADDATTPSTCSDRIRTVTIWLNAFIPKDVSGLTTKVPDHAVKITPTLAGKTMFVTKFGCGLTDQRSFSADVNASSRMHSEATIDLDRPRIVNQTHRIHPSIELDCVTGKIVCNKTASNKPMSFSFIGITQDNEIMVAVKGSQGPACPDSRLKQAAARFLLGAKIDYEGTFFIKRVARNYVDIYFLGHIDLFPAYEIVAKLNNSNPVHLGGKLPAPGSSPVTHLGSRQGVHLRRRLWLKCESGKEVAGVRGTT